MNAMSPPDINQRVAQYVMLRDLIKKMDDEHKAKMEPFRDTLEKLNSVLLGHLNNINSESVRTDSGTVYRKTKKSASIADMGAFWTYVVTQADWDMVDKKANVTAVEAYIEANKALPPGVNFSAVNDVGVRRA